MTVAYYGEGVEGVQLLKKQIAVHNSLLVSLLDALSLTGKYIRTQLGKKRKLQIKSQN